MDTKNIELRKLQTAIAGALKGLRPTLRRAGYTVELCTHRYYGMNLEANGEIMLSLDGYAVPINDRTAEWMYSEGYSAESVSEWRTVAGPLVSVGLLVSGEMLAYRLSGQGIAEQVGTSRMPEDELLTTLLSPLGLQARPNGQIVEAESCIV